MTTNYAIQTRAFAVQIKDLRTGEEKADMIVLDLETLHMAQQMGESSHEVILRAYNRQGYKVLDIGKAVKRTINLDLKELYKAHCLHEVGKREKVGA